MSDGADDGARALLVTAAVIRDMHGRVLLARRHPQAHMGGLWEFPGGKVKDGESPAAGLARELVEELGVETRVGEPLTFAVHEEPGLRIVLLFFAVSVVSGDPHSREGQEIAWVPLAELASYQTPPADAALVKRLVSSER